MNNNSIQVSEPIPRDRATTKMMKCFEELTFKERLVRTLRGINQPKNNSDYKFAKLQIQLLSGPILAFIIPLICIGILLSIESTVKTHGTITAVDLVDQTERPQIEDPPPQQEDRVEFDHVDIEFARQSERFNSEQVIDVISHAPLSPKPGEIDAVAFIKSRVVMSGIHPRSPSRIGVALKRYDGTREGQLCVIRALRWLKSKQLENGSWPGQPAAMTGLALLTFLAHGETPGPHSEEFGTTVEKGIRYLISNQQENGLFASKDGSNYAHPIATYALCEAWTLTKVPMLKTAAEKALGHIVRGQHPNGGWDYNMRQTERDDTSYMGWCAQAIKAGRMAGDLNVDNLEKTYRNAVNGFKVNANPSGGFGYVSKGKTGLTGVGVLCMQLLGAGNDPDVTTSLNILSECTYSFETWQAQPYGGSSPIYYWYYITQAKFHAGRNHWKSWNRMFQPELIKRQVVIEDIYEYEGRRRDIGYWDSPSAKEHGSAGGEKGIAIRYENGVIKQTETSDGNRVQDTTLSAMQLMVYYRHLPTFQTPEAVHDNDVVNDIEDVSINIIM